MRIPLPRGRFVILHPLRIGLVLGLVGVMAWGFNTFGGEPMAPPPQEAVIPFVILEDGSEAVVIDVTADQLSVPEQHLLGD